MANRQIELSRRKVLGSMGTIGAAAAGVSLGTTAFFSDRETFGNNSLVAGSLDLKAAATHHYVDWLGDEADDGSMAGTDAAADLVLEAGDQSGARDIRLEIDSAAGLATGSVDNTVNGGVPVGADFGGSLCDVGDDVGEEVLIDLGDVKPGDFGIARFGFAACDNPGFLWLTGDLESASENGVTEPEADDPDEDQVEGDGNPPQKDGGDASEAAVELLDAIRVTTLDGDAVEALVAAASDDDGSGGDPTLRLSGDLSLREVLEGGLSLPLDGDIPAAEGGGAEGARPCFSAGTNHRRTLVWWLPLDHGNEVQTDAATFSLGLYAEQCRHNDGSGLTERRIRVLSSPAEFVSGGDALVQIDLPLGARFDEVSILLDGTDVTDQFNRVPDDGRLEGVIAGLAEGSNRLELRLRGDVIAARNLVNHPQSGPMFSGPHQEPFGCALDTFDDLPDLTPANPTNPTDCEASERVDYVYKNQDGDFQVFDPDDGVPGDVAQTTTTDGQTVDYVVRLERGTINRFLYSIAMLAPGETSPDDPDYSAWNDKLIYKFEGGVAIGHQQGDPDEDDMLLDMGLSKGYAVVYSTGTSTSTHYDLQVGGETALMVKEEFVERHGPPEYTVGMGDSGGAIQQYVYGQNHPGLLDAAIPTQSYPDMVTQTIHVGDCELLEFYMDQISGNPVWDDWDNRQWIEGLNSESDEFNPWTGSEGASECVKSWRGLSQLVLNPFFTDGATGLTLTPQLLQDVEWTHWADLKQIYGLDQFGFGRRTWDNVGVQYGLQAFREGKISADEFLTLNAAVGSWKETRNMQPPGQPFNPNASQPDPYDARNMNHGSPAPREEGSVEAMEAAYESGIVFHGEIDIPIVDVRPYLEEVLDMHNSHQSFAARQRMIDWKGHADNQLIWFVEPPEENESFLEERALAVVDEWMANVQANPDTPVGDLRPPRAVDACFDDDHDPIAQGDDVWNGILADHECGTGSGDHPGTRLSDATPDAGCGECARKFQIYTSSRIIAGGPIGGDVFKCQRKPVEEALADGTYGDWNPSQQQVQQLKAIFPDGVCDYSEPDAGRPANLGQ